MSHCDGEQRCQLRGRWQKDEGERAVERGNDGSTSLLAKNAAEDVGAALKHHKYCSCSRAQSLELNVCRDLSQNSGTEPRMLCCPDYPLLIHLTVCKSQTYPCRLQSLLVIMAIPIDALGAYTTSEPTPAFLWATVGTGEKSHPSYTV